MNSSVEYEEYKGHQLIKIFTGKTWLKDGEEQREYITFGERKAIAIVEQFDQIRKFAGFPSTKPATTDEKEDKPHDDIPF